MINKNNIHEQCWIKERYQTIRVANDTILSNNFLYTHNPYSPHFVLIDWTLYLIKSDDEGASIIDAKTSRMRNTSTQSLHETIKPYITKQIEKLQHQYRSSLPSKSAIQKYTRQLIKDNKSKKEEQINHISVANKLYNETKKKYPHFWDKETIKLTEPWRTYFSQIIGKFLKYNEDNDFLGRKRREWLFPYNTWQHLRSKLTKNEKLTTWEIVEFINYLLTKEEKKEKESPLEEQDRRHRNHTKSMVINMLYTLMYTEQYYDYNTIAGLSWWFWSSLSAIDNNIWEQNAIWADDIYTEWGIKGLSSLAIKELRWEFATDLLRWRTWIESSHLQWEKKHEQIQSIFDTAISNIKTYYQEQWYEIEITDFGIANKFKAWNIIFEEKKIEIIEKTIYNKNLIIKENKKWDNNIRDFFSFDISNLSEDIIPKNAKDWLQFALDRDNSKTWSNGSYADIKLRMKFKIRKIWEDKWIDNLSYEHQIVNMDSENEAWVSDHNIFLDPLKTIQAKLRTESAIDTSLFINSVSGGIDKTIRELTILQWYLDQPSKKPNNMSEKFIKTQLKIRNKVPQEILTIAGITWSVCYTDLDKNYHQKQAIELAVVQYLLKDQFEKGRLHRFVYENELEDLLQYDDMVKKSNQYPITYILDHNKLIEYSLDPNHSLYGKCCVCGWWSNNFVKSIMNTWYTEKANIGIKNKNKDEIYLMPSYEVHNIVSQGMSIKNQSIILDRTTADTSTDIINAFKNIT